MPMLADKIGRKRAIQVICVVCVISAVLQAAAVHLAMLLVGRFLNGVGYVLRHSSSLFDAGEPSMEERTKTDYIWFSSAMVDVIVPLYQSEVSPPKTRGRLVGSHGFLVVVGYVCDFRQTITNALANRLFTESRGLGRFRQLLRAEPTDSMAIVSCTSKYYPTSSHATN